MKHIHGVILTQEAPFSNYRGESDANLVKIQTLSIGDAQFAIVSSQAIRNGLRETLADELGPELVHRERVYNADQLQVRYKDVLRPDKYADVAGFGGLNLGSQKKKNAGKLAKDADTGEKTHRGWLRVNHARSLFPFTDESTMHQSPQASEDSAYKNAEGSGLYSCETMISRFQFPFSLNLTKAVTKDQQEWMRTYLSVLSDPFEVSGNHSRTLFPFEPYSIVVRATDRRTPEFDMYGFAADGSFKELSRLNENDLPANEFWIAGGIVRDMDSELRARLTAAGAHLYDNPSRMMKALGEKLYG